MLLQKLQEYLAIIVGELKSVGQYEKVFLQTRNVQFSLGFERVSNICFPDSSIVMVIWRPCDMFTENNHILELPSTTYICIWRQLYYFWEQIQNIFIYSQPSSPPPPTHSFFSLSAIILYHFSSFIN